MLCSELNDSSEEIPVVFTSSDGSVAKIQTDLGPIYRIRARVLPHLSGAICLFPLTAGDWVMIDAGCGNEESNSDLEHGMNILRSEFDKSFSVSAIRRIILTHAHIDHFGGVYEWKRRTGAEVWIHAFESRLVSHYDDCARVENMRYAHWLRESGVLASKVQEVLDGFGFRPGRARSVAVDRMLYGGEKFGPLKFFYLPGHSSGHMVFLFGNVVFSGDLLLSKTVTQIWPARMTPQTGLINYIMSLKRFETIAGNYEARFGKKIFAIPAHEDLIVNIPERVAIATRAMEKRNNRVLKLLADSEAPLSLDEITRKMYWSGSTNREFFALSDVGSRVEFLLQLGLIDVVNSESVSCDSPTILYKRSLANTETAENTVEQIVRMYLTCNDSDAI